MTDAIKETMKGTRPWLRYGVVKKVSHSFGIKYDRAKRIANGTLAPHDTELDFVNELIALANRRKSMVLKMQ